MAKAVRVELLPRCPAEDEDFDVPAGTRLCVRAIKTDPGQYIWHAQLPKKAWGFENLWGGATKRGFPRAHTREAAWRECKNFLLRAEAAGVL